MGSNALLPQVSIILATVPVLTASSRTRFPKWKVMLLVSSIAVFTAGIELMLIFVIRV
jgi:hypothetical protein